MKFYLELLFLAFGATGAVMVPYIHWLFKMKYTRKGEENEERKDAPKAFYEIRKMQSAKPPLVTSGGVPILAVVTLLFAVLYNMLGQQQIISGHPWLPELSAIFFTFIGFGVLGLYDDVIKIFGYSKNGFFGLRMRHKFLLQWILALVAAAILYFGLKIDFINVPFWGIIHLGWIYFFLAAFLIVGFANAFDITDGLDGLSGGLLMICLMAFWLIAMRDLDHVMSAFIAMWLGSLIAYLYFNIYPARIMLGNAGGLAFGATMAVIGLLSGKMFAMLIIGGVFLAEGASSLLQLFSKKFMKKRIFPIAPFHHWLQIAGWEEPKIVARAWLAGLALAIFGVWLAVL